jgi:hypothetical protein
LSDYLYSVLEKRASLPGTATTDARPPSHVP